MCRHKYYWNIVECDVKLPNQPTNQPTCHLQYMSFAYIWTNNHLNEKVTVTKTRKMAKQLYISSVRAHSMLSVFLFLQKQRWKRRSINPPETWKYRRSVSVKFYKTSDSNKNMHYPVKIPSRGISCLSFVRFQFKKTRDKRMWVSYL